MKPFNLEASNLEAAVAKDRAESEEAAERRLSMCVYCLTIMAAHVAFEAQRSGMGAADGQDDNGVGGEGRRRSRRRRRQATGS
jgi:hypothetical protein